MSIIPGLSQVLEPEGPRPAPSVNGQSLPLTNHEPEPVQALDNKSPRVDVQSANAVLPLSAESALKEANGPDTNSAGEILLNENTTPQQPTSSSTEHPQQIVTETTSAPQEPEPESQSAYIDAADAQLQVEDAPIVIEKTLPEAQQNTPAIQVGTIQTGDVVVETTYAPVQSESKGVVFENADGKDEDSTADVESKESEPQSVQIPDRDTIMQVDGSQAVAQNILDEPTDTQPQREDIVMGDTPPVQLHEQTPSSERMPEVTMMNAAESVVPTSQGASLAFDADFIEAARANRDNPAAEFAEDSDPELLGDSTDSSDSDSDETSSDDDSDYGSVILSPEEAARMLMRASPEEGGGSSGPPRTANEQMEKPLPIKKVEDMDEVKIVELGHISHIINQINCVVIRATIHHEHNVLQPGTALCTIDRTQIRPISDTIAQVQEPYYIAYFESPAEIAGFGLQENMKIFYIDDPDHRSFVFYDELRRQKFTDASNINDEEVDDREIEFSDDEAEAAYKREKKEAKRGRGIKQEDDDDASIAGSYQGGRGRGRGRGSNRTRGARGGRGGWQDYDRGSRAPEVPTYAPQVASAPASGLDYGDDAGEQDGYYKKLARPDDYGTWQNTPAPVTIKQEEGTSSQPQVSHAYSKPQSSNELPTYVPPASYSSMNTQNQHAGGRGRGSNRGYRGGDQRRGDGQRRDYGSGSQYQQNASQPHTSPAPQYPLPQGPYQPQFSMPQQSPMPQGFVPPPPPNWNNGYGVAQQGGQQPAQNSYWPPQQGGQSFQFGAGIPQTAQFGGIGATGSFSFGQMQQGGFQRGTNEYQGSQTGYQAGQNGNQSGGDIPYTGNTGPYGGYQNYQGGNGRDNGQ